MTAAETMRGRFADSALSHKLVARALLAVAVVVIALAWLAPGTYRAVSFTAPDSVTYLGWDQMRPVVYPMVLSVVGHLSPTLEILGPLQLGIYLASALWLALSFHHVLRRPLLASGLGVAVMGHPQAVSYAFTVLPESLLMSLVMVHVACVMRLLATRHARWAFMAGFTMAAAILTKPVALSLLVGCVLLVRELWRAPGRRHLALTGGATLLLPIVAAGGFNYFRLGVFSPQVAGGYAVLGVTSTFMAEDTQVEPPELGRTLLERTRAIRTGLAQIDSLELYYIYSSTAYHAALEVSAAAIEDYLRASDPSASASRTFLRLNEVARSIAVASIGHNPRGYARHVAAHLYGLWMIPLLQNASRHAEFVDALEDVRSRSPQLAVGPILFRIAPAYAYWPFKAFLVAAVLSSFVAIGVAVVRRGATPWSIAAYAALLLHSYFLLTALAQTGLPRYAVTAWPLTVTVVFGVLAAVWPFGWRRAHSADVATAG